MINKGIQGPIGPNQIDPALLYKATTNTNVSRFLTISNATCDPGDVVVEGGYVTANQDDIDTFIENPSDNGNQYRILAADISGRPIALTATAICFDNPPAH